MYNLREELSALKNKSAERLPKDTQAKFNAAIDELKANEANFGLPIGSIAPNFSLVNQHGKTLSLYEELKENIVILFFYRGDWCPYCNLQLIAYQDLMPSLDFYGAKLIAVNPQLPDSGMGLTQKHQIEFDILSDLELQVAEMFKLKFELPDYLQTVYKELGLDLTIHNANHEWELPLAATFIINKDATILSSFVNVDYKERMTPTEILSTLKSL